MSAAPLQIEVREWQQATFSSRELCQAAGLEARALAHALSPLLQVEPDFDGTLRLSATRKVGELQVGALFVSVTPAIEIGPLLELLGWVVGAKLHLASDALGAKDSIFQRFTIRMALAAGLVIAARELLRGELHRHYSRHQEQLLVLRGRPDFERLGLRPASSGVPCRYLELTRDTWPNRVLAAGLHEATTLLQGSGFHGESMQLAALLGTLVSPEVPVGPADVLRAFEALGHRYQRYERALVLSRLLLFGGGPISVVGSGGMSGWWIDMPSLFERAVIDGVRAWAVARELHVEVQPRHRGAILDGALDVYQEARPDLVVSSPDRSTVLAMIDAKYKPYFRADPETGKPLRQVERDDLYQLALYTSLYPEARHFIVSPLEPDRAMISERYRVLFLQGRRLELLPVDLRRLPRQGELALW